MLKTAAVDGVLDLSDWNYDQTGIAELNGQWLFYPEIPDLSGEQTLKSLATVRDVPNSWEKPGTGFGTYRLKVILPEGLNKAGIYTESQGSAYRLIINDRVVLSNGHIAADREGMIAEKRPRSSLFYTDSGDVELFMQISNFHHRKGGFRNPLIIGTEKNINRLHGRERFRQIFSFSIYLILGIYHSIFYLFRKKNREALYFAMVCFLMAFRVGFTNQKILLDFFTSIPWSASLKIEYLTFYFSAPVFYLYLSSLYPEYIKPWFNRSLLILVSIYSLFTIWSGTMVASLAIPSFQVIMMFLLAIFAFILIRLVIDRKEGAVLIASVSLVLILSAIVDILYFREFLPFGDILPFSFLTFIFIQALMLSSRFARAFSKVEDLSHELEKANISLVRSETRYRNLFEQSSDMIILTDRNFNITGINPSVQSTLGYGEKDLLGKKVNMLIPFRDVWMDFIKSVRNNHVIHNQELKLQKASGEEIFVLLTAEKRHHPDGSHRGYYASIKDITDRKRAELEKIRSLELERMAFTDSLTGVYNRRFFTEVAEKELSRARRRQTCHSLCLIDVDHFKIVNDTYGHMTGDDVLIKLAAYCQNHIRSIDFVARYGGEEFVILLTDIDSGKAVELIEKLRSSIEAMALAEREGQEIRATISAGIVHFNHQDFDSLESLMDKADQALYQSKESGRNRVTVFKA